MQPPQNRILRPTQKTPTDKAALPRVQIEIQRGQAKSRLREVAVPAFLIGAAADCDMVLGDTQFPEVHSYLLCSERGITLRHLGFQPGLTVNGISVSQATLVDGDRIRTGPYEFVMHIGPALATARPASSAVDEQPAPQATGHQEVIVDEVRALLDQIRQELRPARSRLRLYSEPEGKSPTTAPPNLTVGRFIRRTGSR